MAGKKHRAEPWIIFMVNRFLPQFWADIRSRAVAQMIALFLAILILLAQYHFGVIGPDGMHARLLSILWPYLALMAIIAVCYAARTPWLISNEHLDSIKTIEGAKAALQQELTERKKVPPKIKVEIIERAFQPFDRKIPDSKSDVFVRARIELIEPVKITITNYKLQLSRYGQVETVRIVDDVAKWGAHVWKASPVVEYGFTPLPMELASGEPVEGWIHSVTETTARNLVECKVRFLVQTDGGSNYGECESDPSSRNPGTLVIVPFTSLSEKARR